MNYKSIPKRAIPNSADPLLLADEAAEYCRCHVETLRLAARQRELAVVKNKGKNGGKNGRVMFYQSDLDKWRRSQVRPASRKAARDVARG